MVPELLRVPVSPLAAGDVVLEPGAARYVTRVHRHGPGDAFVAFDPEARMEADARVLSVDRVVRCRVEGLRPAKTIANTGITLVQSLGKGDKPDRIIRDATALGAERIVFCLSRRTVARPGERAPARLERFRAVAVEAARQSGRGDVPVILGPLPYEEAITPESARLGLRVCLVPNAPVSFAVAIQKWRRGDPLCLLVGPEGGLDDGEVRAAQAAGFVLASFGDFVLRTETIAVAVLGALVALR